jgi:hypothetical protein
MPKFNVGDYVEPIGTLVPDDVRQGVILRVFPNEEGLDWATEYEIEFKFGRAKFFERQLRLTKPAPASDLR